MSSHIFRDASPSSSVLRVDGKLEPIEPTNRLLRPTRSSEQRSRLRSLTPHKDAAPAVHFSPKTTQKELTAREKLLAATQRRAGTSSSKVQTNRDYNITAPSNSARNSSNVNLLSALRATVDDDEDEEHVSVFQALSRLPGKQLSPDQSIKHYFADSQLPGVVAPPVESCENDEPYFQRSPIPKHHHLSNQRGAVSSGPVTNISSSNTTRSGLTSHESDDWTVDGSKRSSISSISEGCDGTDVSAGQRRNQENDYLSQVQQKAKSFMFSTHVELPKSPHIKTKLQCQSIGFAAESFDGGVYQPEPVRKVVTSSHQSGLILATRKEFMGEKDSPPVKPIRHTTAQSNVSIEEDDLTAPPRVNASPSGLVLATRNRLSKGTVSTAAEGFGSPRSIRGNGPTNTASRGRSDSRVRFEPDTTEAPIKPVKPERPLADNTISVANPPEPSESKPMKPVRPVEVAGNDSVVANRSVPSRPRARSASPFSSSARDPSSTPRSPFTGRKSLDQNKTYRSRSLFANNRYQEEDNTDAIPSRGSYIPGVDEELEFTNNLQNRSSFRGRESEMFCSRSGRDEEEEEEVDCRSALTIKQGRIRDEASTRPQPTKYQIERSDDDYNYNESCSPSLSSFFFRKQKNVSDSKQARYNAEGCNSTRSKSSVNKDSRAFENRQRRSVDAEYSNDGQYETYDQPIENPSRYIRQNAFDESSGHINRKNLTEEDANINYDFPRRNSTPRRVSFNNKKFYHTAPTPGVVNDEDDIGISDITKRRSHIETYYNIDLQNARIENVRPRAKSPFRRS